jgi:hypothetical protein
MSKKPTKKPVAVKIARKLNAVHEALVNPSRPMLMTAWQ